MQRLICGDFNINWMDKENSCVRKLYGINFHAMSDVNLEYSLTYFKHTKIDEVNVLLSKMNKTTCMFDPFPTGLLLDFSHLFIDVIVSIINLTFSSASFPVAFKSAVVKPLLKKNYT